MLRYSKPHDVEKFPSLVCKNHSQKYMKNIHINMDTPQSAWCAFK